MEKNWHKVDLYFYEAVDLKDLIGCSYEEIDDNISVIYADYKTVTNNFDFLLKVIKIMMKNGFLINL